MKKGNADPERVCGMGAVHLPATFLMKPLTSQKDLSDEGSSTVS